MRVGGSHPESPLQQARVKAGIRQETIAEAIGRDPRTVQRYEAGKQVPNQTTLRIMQQEYRCDANDLFYLPPPSYSMGHTES